MKVFARTALVIALGLSAAAAMAGQVVNSNVNAANASNTSAGLGSSATQQIGGAEIGRAS